MTPTTDKVFGVRIPKRLADELEEVAAREANSMSAVARRLLSRGLEAEQRDAQHRLTL
jgi:metal-responsive CopG/Arc/MetJ family transcriptional regulator